MGRTPLSERHFQVRAIRSIASVELADPETGSPVRPPRILGMRLVPAPPRMVRQAPETVDPVASPADRFLAEEVDYSSLSFNPQSFHDLPHRQNRNRRHFRSRTLERCCPKHCENFMKLAKDGFYDGLAFHRVIQDFRFRAVVPTPAREPAVCLEPAVPVGPLMPNSTKKSTTRCAFDGSEPRPQQCRKPVLCVLGTEPLSAPDRQYTAFGCVTSGIESVREIGTGCWSRRRAT